MKSLRHWGWVGFLLALVLGAIQAEAEVLSRLSDVRDLSREEAAKGLPVHVRCVVTWRDPEGVWFTAQDGSAGIPVEIDQARMRHIWVGDSNSLAQIRAGLEVEIEGVTLAGGFAPGLLPRTLRVMGEKPMPEARMMIPARFFGGSDSCERIEVRGVVQGFRPWRDGWALRMEANPGSFTAELPGSALDDPERLVDAELCLRGIAATRFNSRGEATGVRLLISRKEDVVVEKPSAISPLDAPKVSINQLLPFRKEPWKGHRQVVEGTVIYAQNKRFFYIQDGSTSIRMETLLRQELKPGDRVEVAGFVDIRRQVAGLAGAVVRKIGTAIMPPAVRIGPDKIIDLNTRAAQSGQAAEPHDFDGQLITFPARLLEVQPDLNLVRKLTQLVLECGGTLFVCVLHDGDTKTIRALKPGSELAVTGIVKLEYSMFPEESDYHIQKPSGLEVLLRSERDVVLTSAPSWWTPERLLRGLAIGLLALAGILLWVWQLHRQLRRKTQELSVEMKARRNAAIEFQATQRERNRLAANLHDTLLQTMTGLNYQLEACESESLPVATRKANHLETARRMVRRGQEDLRGTVWALRVLPLHGGTFEEALRALANQHSERRDVLIKVTIEGDLPRLSDFVAGNLLLVAQEAMHNALNHAHSTQITCHIVATSDSKRIVLTVKDNGSGFSSSVADSPASSGHFGLKGMRERIERLGGVLRIESSPGSGTSVCADVPLRAFDDELA